MQNTLSERTRLLLNPASIIALLLFALWAYHDRSKLWCSIWLLLAAAQALSMIWQRWGTRVN